MLRVVVLLLGALPQWQNYSRVNLAGSRRAGCWCRRPLVKSASLRSEHGTLWHDFGTEEAMLEKARRSGGGSRLQWNVDDGWWKSMVVEVEGRETMEFRSSAFRSYIPLEFASNKQTHPACCFVLDEARSPRCGAGTQSGRRNAGGWPITNARQYHKANIENILYHLGGEMTIGARVDVPDAAIIRRVLDT